MKGLIFETSTEKGLIAFGSASKALLGGPTLSKTLALEVELLLDGCRPDYIAVGTGPGSYTGIRVGAALAKALAFGWDIPLFGFCSLAAFQPQKSAPVIVDARMGGFYVLKEETPVLLSLEAAQRDLCDYPLLASPHPDLIQKRLPLPGAWIETNPDPQLLAALAHNLFLNGNPVSLALSYLTIP